jgi:hypothetical protein
MKKVFITFVLIIQIVVVIYSQQRTAEDFYLHNGRKTFHLRMPVSEVLRILGPPNEIITHTSQVPNHFDRIVLRYPEIEFHHYVFFDDPEILLIAFWGHYQIGNMDVIGNNREEIFKKYGEPEGIEAQGDYLYYRYQFNLSWVDNVILQFRFNSLGICDGVLLIHGVFYL